MTEKTSPENTKPTSTPRQRKASAEEPEREELKGVLRTSRIGPVEWRGATSGSTEDDLTQRRHAALEEAKKPGDDGYNAHKDPLVPSSTLATVIMTELAGGDESPTWNALNDAYQAQHEEFEAIRKFREDRAKKAS